MYYYIFNPWQILFCNLRIHEVYNNIHQAVPDECCYKLHTRERSSALPYTSV